MIYWRYILPLCFVFLSVSLSAQSIKAIKEKQAKTEKEIQYLNKLLKETRTNKSVTTQQLTIIRQKIAKGKESIETLHKEVKYYEKLIADNELLKANLEADKEKMLDLYAKLVYETWKKRKNSDKLIYLFSSSGLVQAYARYKYFEQIQNYSKRQIQSIENMNDSLTTVNKRLSNLITQKNEVQSQLHSKNTLLIKEQNEANHYMAVLQKTEQSLNKKLNIEKKNRNRFTKELQKLIDSQVKKSGSKNSNYKLTSEEKLISDDFAKNKGKLPWPVKEGFVSEKFGVNVHPVFKQVKLSNDGITITTSPHAEVRSVFSGVVAEIMFITGYNNVVIIRHGNYLTLYSNLVNVYVKKGEKISVKTPIGKLATADKNSTLNFQIWKDKSKLNPETWLSPL